MTDFDGRFVIRAAENSILNVTFIGFDSYQLNVGTNNQFTVSLRESSQSLSEVVVMGYAAPVRKRDITSSVQSISAESISNNADVSQSLAGKVAGVQVQPTPQNDVIVAEDSKAINDVKENFATGNDVTESEDLSLVENKSKTWNSDRLYLKALAAAPKEKQYELYFELRKTQERNPSFYFDIAHFFYNQGDVKKALQVISNIADLGLENHQLYKTLTYTLRQWQDYEDALFTARQIAKWRSHEPQSLRDYALALEDAGKYQEAFDELIKALEVNYYGEMSGQYEGVEDIILMDINRLTIEH